MTIERPAQQAARWIEQAMAGDNPPQAFDVMSSLLIEHEHALKTLRGLLARATTGAVNDSRAAAWPVHESCRDTIRERHPELEKTDD